MFVMRSSGGGLPLGHKGTGGIREYSQVVQGRVGGDCVGAFGRRRPSGSRRRRGRRRHRCFEGGRAAHKGGHLQHGSPFDPDRREGEQAQGGRRQGRSGVHCRSAAAFDVDRGGDGRPGRRRLRGQAGRRRAQAAVGNLDVNLQVRRPGGGRRASQPERRRLPPGAGEGPRLQTSRKQDEPGPPTFQERPV